MLKKIIDHLGVTGQIDMTRLKAKPFPLLYEEIFLRSLKTEETSEISVKKYIASLTSNFKPNIIHKQIMDLEIEDIMTTNYEYTLQQSLLQPEQELENLGHIKETTYNIFRHNKVKKTKVWHIHGECDVPLSITLGYEHYGGLLQKMRNYVVTGTDYAEEKNLAPLVKRFSKGKLKEHSWLDLFFTKDIHIWTFFKYFRN
jgi:hypothetical protein